MSIHHVTTTWVGKLTFDSEVNNHIVRIDAKPPLGGNTGPGPKALLLTALTGCTGMDVAALLPKMRVAFDRLVIEAEAEQTEEHPKVYKSIKLTFRIAGKEVDEIKVRKAIELSQDKYCGVTAMLRAHCPITWELVIEQV
ncbi:MAG: OsmC family peroxiredoxin [Haliscomenobacteraceae bacterium CHB4]|nr:Protein YhfA [Saprospiraceae bacterium]MCE7926067.1 OsmC family peroxiredoxin [Haliscomenobacteraceae bacterium CHB4]